MSDPPGCRTCRHWILPERFDDDIPGGWGTCGLAASDDEEPRSDETLAYARAANAILAELLTSGRFLCSQWESDEDE